MFTLWKRVAEMCGCGRRAVAVAGGWGRGEEVKNERRQARRSGCEGVTPPFNKKEAKTVQIKITRASVLQARYDPPHPTTTTNTSTPLRKATLKTHQRLSLVTVPRAPPPFSSAQLIERKKKTSEEEENKDLNEHRVQLAFSHLMALEKISMEGKWGRGRGWMDVLVQSSV